MKRSGETPNKARPAPTSSRPEGEAKVEPGEAQTKARPAPK